MGMEVSVLSSDWLEASGSWRYKVPLQWVRRRPETLWVENIVREVLLLRRNYHLLKLIREARAQHSCSALFLKKSFPGPAHSQREWIAQKWLECRKTGARKKELTEGNPCTTGKEVRCNREQNNWTVSIFLPLPDLRKIEPGVVAHTLTLILRSPQQEDCFESESILV